MLNARLCVRFSTAFSSCVFVNCRLNPFRMREHNSPKCKNVNKSLCKLGRRMQYLSLVCKQRERERHNIFFCLRNAVGVIVVGSLLLWQHLGGWISRLTSVCVSFLGSQAASASHPLLLLSQWSVFTNNVQSYKCKSWVLSIALH